MYSIVILCILVFLMIGLACITNFKLKKFKEKAEDVITKAENLSKLMDYTEDDLIGLRLTLAELSDVLRVIEEDEDGDSEETEEVFDEDDYDESDA